MQNGSKWPAQPIVSNSTSTRNKTWIHYLVFRGFISWIVLRSRFVVNVRRGANCFAIGTAIFLTHSQLNLFTFTFACVRIRKCNCKHIYIYMYLNLDTNAGKKTFTMSIWMQFSFKTDTHIFSVFDQNVLLAIVVSVKIWKRCWFNC